MIEVYRYEQSLAEVSEIFDPIIFLAGPTVRGHQQHLGKSWRYDAIAEFEKQGFDGILIVPEFSDPAESDKDKTWIPAWEYTGLCVSDINMFWIPRTRELIGLTTNHEHGYWLGRYPSKVVYGRPNDAYRIKYLDLMYDYTRVDAKMALPPICNTLAETVEMAIYRSKLPLGGGSIKTQIAVDSPYNKEK